MNCYNLQHIYYTLLNITSSKFVSSIVDDPLVIKSSPGTVTSTVPLYLIPLTVSIIISNPSFALTSSTVIPKFVSRFPS